MPSPTTTVSPILLLTHAFNLFHKSYIFIKMMSDDEDKMSAVQQSKPTLLTKVISLQVSQQNFPRPPPLCYCLLQ